jgi:serine/threonine-protein kinase
MKADPHADTLPSDPASSGDGEERDELLGKTLGHFRVDARLGRGGMGAVYRAWDASLEREVALKVLLAASDSARERFLREARVQAKLKHPNVVPIHFVGQQGDISFLVMDVIEGESLSDVLARHPVLTESQALDMADAIAAALAAGSDAGLVHRDVKPSNILIDKSGRILLADFGLAKTVTLDLPLRRPASGGSADSAISAPTTDAPEKSGTLTRAGAILGTPAYLAPEQARGDVVDFRADMYALGVTLYEALAGQPPFTGENAAALLKQHLNEEPIKPRTLAPHMRPAVEALVMKLLAKDPAARFASYPELRAAIASAREKPSTPATFFVRLVAFAVDLLAIGAYAAVVYLLSRSATIGWVVSIVSFAALERVWSTPGKKLMRLRVVDRRGDPPPWSVVIARSLLRMFGPITMAIAADLLGKILHLRTADDLVTGLGFFAWMIALAIGIGGRPLHDRVLKTREVFV